MTTKLPYRWPADRILGWTVIDGDTVEFTFDLGFHVHAVHRCRLTGIDAPEMVGEHRVEGLAAKNALVRVLTKFGVNRVETTKADKYGRYLARIFGHESLKEVDLNKHLIEFGFAKEYNP